jgi:phospholipid/cholesterol/gamma-HCH transport system substrate-binding protein
MIRLRHTDEWVGVLVLVTGVIFFIAILHAGVLRDWFRPVSHLRVVLPEMGAAGLSVGADVEILGTQVGTVRRIVINPNQQMYAEADIDEQARPFVRRDSRALIRRRYGIAGAAFLDISRGTGSELDWNYAVIGAVTERDPTENIGALIDQAREKVFPILDDLGRSVKSLAGVIEGVQKGEGDVGRLLTDDTMVRNTEGVVAKADVAISDLAQLASQLQMAGRNVETLSQTINSPDNGVPRLLQRADASLATLQQSVRDLALATQRAPQLVHNVELGSRDLPGLLTQTQQTAHELEQLAIQLRGLWLLGGGGKPTPEPTRLPPHEVRP